MERKVIVIAKAEPLQTDSSGTVRKKRVCAYARVSTDFEDQKNSFNAQLDEFKKRIQRNPEWEFVNLYSDEGISGTSLKRREGFNRMIDDALKGKIDLILVKSISRFARNTIDFLGKIRELKAKNVEVFFEKENSMPVSLLDTKKMKTEILESLKMKLKQYVIFLNFISVATPTEKLLNILKIMKLKPLKEIQSGE